MDNLPGSDSVQPIGALGPFDSDVVLPRLHGLSPLTGSPLDSLLRNNGIRTIVVMGVSLNIAIPNLVFDAVNRSYQVVLVSDAVAGVPPAYGEQMIQHTLSLLCTIATSDEITRTWMSAG
jgi:nicotinamidase-related amidase